MADIGEIRQALSDALDTIPDLQTSPYLLASPTPPAAEIQPSMVSFDKAMRRGLDRLRFVVRAYVSLNLSEAGQKRLDRMLAGDGAFSIKAAIEADRTLGGACSDAHVTECTGYRVYERIGAGSVLGAEWTVEVLAPGT